MGHTKKEKCSHMKVLDLFTQYEQYLRQERPLSVTTMKNYRCRAERFVQSFPPDAQLAALSRQKVVTYLNGIASPRAVRMQHAAISHFCKWLVSHEYLRASPATNIPLPTVKRNRRKPVPEDAVSRLLQACDRLPTTEYRQALSKAAFCLLVYGALRRCECVGLLVDDVRLDTGEVYIRHGKGGQSRCIYVCKECIDAIRAMLDLRPVCDHDFLLAQSRKFGMGFHGLRQLLIRLHMVAGLEEVYTPHRLRHSCASRLAANGAPLPTIQAFLGHKHLSTTAIYLHTDAEQLKSIAHLASLSPQSAPTKETAPAPAREEAKRFRVRRLR